MSRLNQKQFVPASLARAAGVCSMAIGGTVLAGWWFKLPALQSFWPGRPRLVLNGGLMLVLLGAALEWMLGVEGGSQAPGLRYRVGQAAALLVAAVGLVTLLEYGFGWNAPVDEFLIKDALAAARQAIPGRLAFPTALSALCFGLGLAFLDVPVRRVWPSQVLGVIGMLIALLALIGSVCDVPEFCGQMRAHRGTSMSVPGAAGFLLLGAGLLCARPERGLMTVLWSHTPGGILARWLMLAPAVGLLLTGLVYAALRPADQAVRIWALGLSNICFVMIPIWAAAHALDQAGLEHDQVHQALEERVEQRTAELTQANKALQAEIAERRQAEKAWREGQQLLQAIIDNSTACVYVKDLDGRYRLINQQWADLFHLGCKDIEGKTDYDVFPRQQAEAFRVFDQQVLAAGRALQAEELAPHDDGLHTYISVKCPLFDAAGLPYAICGISTDITEHKQAEEDVREARDRLEKQAVELEHRVAERTAKLRETIGDLEAFSYSVAHDMRAPLRGMQGFARLLLDEHASQLNSDAQTYLERIASSASRMDALIQDALNYTRMLRADSPLTSVDLDQLVRHLVASYPNWQPPKTEIHIAGALPPALGHEGFLTQCVSNLVGNAVKFVAPGVIPRVRVWAESRESHVRLCVEDNGIGIARKDHERVFRMFERLNHVSQYEGTGIGLAIVHKAAERMGGSVDFVSEPGKGSTFWIELKKAPPA